MKRFISALILPALMCSMFIGCGKKTAAPELKAVPSQNGVTQVSAGQVPTSPDGKPIIPEPGPKQVADGRLLVTSFSPYSGLYPEDGSDTQAENVAAILVENISDQACQYCRMTFLIEDEPAEFCLSELPAGAQAWVMEANGLVIADGDTFFFEDDECLFREEESLTGFTCTAGDGSLTVTNESGEDISSLFVYYKLLADDGAFLGGICHRAQIGALAAGETKTVSAEHLREGACEIVGIYLF